MLAAAHLRSLFGAAVCFFALEHEQESRRSVCFSGRLHRLTRRISGLRFGPAFENRPWHIAIFILHFPFDGHESICLLADAKFAFSRSVPNNSLLGERQAEAYLPRGRFGMMSIS